MRSGVRWLRRGFFGVGIAVALAFGGFQAFASPTAMGECPTTPPYFGECETKAECQAMCDAYYDPDPYEGFCGWVGWPIENVCCICIAM